MAGPIKKDTTFWGFKGINNSISPFQKQSKEAQIALNGFFNTYGTYSTYEKRKGRTRINSTALSGSVTNLFDYNAKGTRYYGSTDSNNFYYSVNLSTGAVAKVGQGLADYPSGVNYNDRLFITTKRDDDEVLNDCTALTNFTTNYAGALDVWAVSADVSAVRTTLVNNTSNDFQLNGLDFPLVNTCLEFDLYIKGIAGSDILDAYQINVRLTDSDSHLHYFEFNPNFSSNLIEGWNHFRVYPDILSGVAIDENTSIEEFRIIITTSSNKGDIMAISDIKTTPMNSALAFTDDNTAIHSIQGSGLPTNDITDLSIFDRRLWAISKNVLYYSNVNAGYDFTDTTTNFITLLCTSTTNSTIVTVSDTSLLLPGMTVSGFGINAVLHISTIDSIHQITLDGDVVQGHVSDLNFASVTSLVYSGSSSDPSKITLDNISYNSEEQLQVGWELSGPNVVAGTTIDTIVHYEDAGDIIRPSVNLTDTAPSSGIAYTFTEPDGAEVVLGAQDASNFQIEKNGGEGTALKTLGNTLFVFKENSIFKVYATNDITIPYRVVPVYTGGSEYLGVGCISKRTVKNINIGAIEGQENYGAQEYLVFESKYGIYVIGQYGGPIKLSNKVKETFNAIPENKRSIAFSLVHPEKNQYWFSYPDYTGFSQNTLVYGTTTKQWSKYNFTQRITASAIYVSETKTYVVLGDSLGFLYKHDYQTTDALADYRDQNADASYSAIDFQWQGVFNAYAGLGRSTELENTFVIAEKTATDCPITITVDNENGDSVSEDIATTGTTDWITKRVPTKLPGLFHRHKFSNAIDQQSAKIYLWSAYPFTQGGDM